MIWSLRRLRNDRRFCCAALVRHLDHNNADIVFTTMFVGTLNQPVARLLGVLSVTEYTCTLIISHQFPQPVRTEHETHTGPQLLFEEVDLHIHVVSQAAQNLIALGMSIAVLGGNEAADDELLHKGVIRRNLM